MPSESPIDTGELPEVSTLSYEQARDELVGIVARLESGQLGLESSMTLWERGEALAAHCTSWLDGAQARLDGATRPDETDQPERGRPERNPPERDRPERGRPAGEHDAADAPTQ